ncbi:MAG: hypothetical protein QM528_02465 [Phycisphaerales bacterium]|nr:hypothetical protein [Phycisphaerales bacterium]
MALQEILVICDSDKRKMTIQKQQYFSTTLKPLSTSNNDLADLAIINRDFANLHSNATLSKNYPPLE